MNFQILQKDLQKIYFEQINLILSKFYTTTFGEEVGSTEIILNASEIEPIKSKLEDFDTLQDRVLRILNSNFVKMTFPVFNGLFDASTEYFKDDKNTTIERRYC